MQAVLIPESLQACYFSQCLLVSLQAKVSDIEPQVLAKGYTGEQYKACITYAVPQQCFAHVTICILFST